MTYYPRHSQVAVRYEGAAFLVDADISGQSALIYGIKLGGKWWREDHVLSCDFTEELESAVDAMPLNADGDVPSSYYKPAIAGSEAA